MCHSVLGSETPSWDKCCGTWSSKGALALVLEAVAFEVVLQLDINEDAKTVKVISVSQ